LFDKYVGFRDIPIRDNRETKVPHDTGRRKLNTMNKIEYLKNEIDSLPPSMLVAVERFIKELKQGKEKPQKTLSLLSNLAEYAIEDDLPADLAEQHDHYLYGLPKK
jgi:hypothetical protein